MKQWIVVEFAGVDVTAVGDERTHLALGYPIEARIVNARTAEEAINEIAAYGNESFWAAVEAPTTPTHRRTTSVALIDQPDKT